MGNNLWETIKGIIFETEPDDGEEDGNVLIRGGEIDRPFVPIEIEGEPEVKEAVQAPIVNTVVQKEVYQEPKKKEMVISGIISPMYGFVTNGKPAEQKRPPLYQSQPPLLKDGDSVISPFYGLYERETTEVEVVKKKPTFEIKKEETVFTQPLNQAPVEYPTTAPVIAPTTQTEAVSEPVQPQFIPEERIIPQPPIEPVIDEQPVQLNLFGDELSDQWQDIDKAEPKLFSGPTDGQAFSTVESPALKRRRRPKNTVMETSDTLLESFEANFSTQELNRLDQSDDDIPIFNKSDTF